jgi:hypothetical protein
MKNASTICENVSTICENVSTRHGRPASRLVKSSPPAFFYFILAPPYRWKPRTTRAARGSSLSVNYLTLS